MHSPVYPVLLNCVPGKLALSVRPISDYVYEIMCRICRRHRSSLVSPIRDYRRQTTLMGFHTLLQIYLVVETLYF